MKLLPVTIAAALLAAPVALAAIEPLDLRKMLERADSAVLGKITQRTVWTFEVPDLGPMEFTTLQIAGDELVDAKGAVTKSVVFVGSAAQPNSEMPSEAETRVGNSVLVFSKNGKAFGMRHDSSWIVAAHGGVFRVETGPKGDVVIGRGEGYAVETSLLAGDLRARVASTLAELRKPK
jgi:hypothetical protein